MATIIEIQDSKFEHLSEYAEKVAKYGKKLMECLEEVDKGQYGDRYGNRGGGSYGMRGRYGSDRYGMRHEDWEEKDYPRYY